MKKGSVYIGIVDNNKKYKAFAPEMVQPVGLVVRKITDVQ